MPSSAARNGVTIPLLAKLTSRGRAASPPPAAPGDVVRAGGGRASWPERTFSPPCHRTGSRRVRRRRSSRCGTAVRSWSSPGADFLTSVSLRGRSSSPRPTAWSTVSSRPKSRRTLAATAWARARGAGPRPRCREAARHAAGPHHEQPAPREPCRHPLEGPECGRVPSAG